jgi:hypothetical protein
VIRRGPSPLAAEQTRFECSTCGGHETTAGDLPQGWEVRAAGHLHVQICGYCIPAWENRPRFARANDTVLVIDPGEGRAWIALDRAAHPDAVAAFTGTRDGATRSWRLHPGARPTHWPMPELGGAAILIASGDGRDGVLFTSDAPGLDQLIAALQRIREGLDQ